MFDSKVMQQLKWELKNRMDERKMRFAVDSVEEAADKLDESVEYIYEVYESENSVPEKVEAWVEDTLTNYPETVVVFV